MSFRKQKGLMVSKFGEFFDPGEVISLMRYSNLDKNILILGSIFDNLSIGEDLMSYFREFLIVGRRDRFLLTWSHYLSNYIKQ